MNTPAGKAQDNSIKDEVFPAINNVLDNTPYVLGKPVAEWWRKISGQN